MNEDRKSTRLNSSHVSKSYAVFCLIRRAPSSTLCPSTTLFRSRLLLRLRVGDRDHLHVFQLHAELAHEGGEDGEARVARGDGDAAAFNLGDLGRPRGVGAVDERRSEEHTSELQSRFEIVCRLLLDTARPEFYALSLHDALPISPAPSPAGWRP